MFHMKDPQILGVTIHNLVASHYTQFSRYGDLSPRICAPSTVRDVTAAVVILDTNVLCLQRLRKTRIDLHQIAAF